MDDPVTADYATRVELEEEEELALASQLPTQYTIQPTIELATELPPRPTLVLLTGPYVSTLAGALFPDEQPIGVITVPELQRLRSPLEEEAGTFNKHQHITELLLASSSSSSSSSSSDSNILIGCMRRELPDEQANTWTDVVLTKLNPRSVVVVSSILAMNYRGPGDPANEDLIFSLSTSSASTSSASGAPTLPAGTALSGLPAALLQRCELGGGGVACEPRPASAIVAVEHAQVPQAGLICRAAEAVAALLGQSPPTADARARVTAVLDAAYRSSAGNSMFV